MEKITREQSLAGGNYRYYDGKPCENGHESGRYVKTGQCVGCCIARVRNYRARKKSAILNFEIVVPPSLSAADRSALLEYLQFVCVPAFLATRGAAQTVK